MCPMAPAAIFAVASGVLTAGLGIGQAVVGAQQAVQQAAFANAQAQQGYAFQQMQASAARNFEQMKANQQDELMRINRLMADNAYGNDIAALNARLMQEQAAASQEQQKGAIAGTKARGEVIASGRLGNTVDNLVADFYRQQAQYDFATSQNLAFVGTQIQLQKQGAAAERGSRIASQQTYIKQPVLDPLEPIYQARPSMTPFILQGISAVQAGVNTGVSNYKNSPESWKQKGGSGGGLGKNYTGGTAAPSLPGNPYSYQGGYGAGKGNYTGGSAAPSLPGNPYSYKRG